MCGHKVVLVQNKMIECGAIWRFHSESPKHSVGQHTTEVASAISFAPQLFSAWCNLYINCSNHHEKVLIRTFSGRVRKVKKLWSLCSHLIGSTCSGKWGILGFVFAFPACPLLPNRSSVWGPRFFILLSRCRPALKLEEQCLWLLLFIIPYNPYTYVQFIGKNTASLILYGTFSHDMIIFSGDLQEYKVSQRNGIFTLSSCRNE